MTEQITEYDPRWAEDFAAEARRLLRGLDPIALRIEHVGSTAVPGLPAKPIIDIQVVVEDQSAALDCHTRLQQLGYTEATAPIYFHHRPATWPHTHHVHVRLERTSDACPLVAFRDWLRAHPDDRDAYAALKRKLAQGVDLHDLAARVRYSEAKTAFIREMVQRAVDWTSTAD